MSAHSRIGLGILLAAVVLGVLGDNLLRAVPWGINVPLCVTALVIAGALIAWRAGLRLAGGGRWLVAPLLVFAAGFIWRDSFMLQLCNALAAFTALALAAARLRAGRVQVAGLVEYAGAGLSTSLYAILGMIPLAAGDVRWKEIPGGQWKGPALGIARGLVIALPLLCCFGALFMAADPVFDRLVQDLIRIDLEDIFSHAFLTVFWTWVVAGLLRLALIADERRLDAGRAPQGLTVGSIEVGVALGALNALFLAFVVVQIRYLFGGAGMVTEATGLTYAEYARRGFFELVTVSALVLPLLLMAHWMARRDSPRASMLFRILAGLLVLLLFVVMASAVQRMRMYQEAYGLTELRLYTTAFMGWLALVFLWFLATVLATERRERFAFGALVAGFLVIAGLNVLNPDDLIARTNLGRTESPVPFDALYAAGLSADAVPALIEGLPSMAPEQQSIVATRLLIDWTAPPQPDWRTWNASRVTAWGLVAAHQSSLEALAGGR